MSETPILALRKVSFAYPLAPSPVLIDVDFDLSPGQRLGLFGPNGCGKTTLLGVMMGLLPATTGQVLFQGRPAVSESDFLELRKSVGLLLQQADDQILFPTVLDDVAFGPLNLGLSPEAARTAALETLDFLGLSGFENRLTHKLSGGQKKMVTLAGVLAMKPKALLLDEPTASLDPAARDRLVGVLGSLDVATLIISHDWEFLSQTAHDFYSIEHGRLILDNAHHAHHHAHAHPLGHIPGHRHD